MVLTFNPGDGSLVPPYQEGGGAGDGCQKMVGSWAAVTFSHSVSHSMKD